MSTIFTPPWTMGNGVGMGAMPHNLDLSVHGHRGGKLRELLRKQMSATTMAYGRNSLAAVYSLNSHDLNVVANHLFKELDIR